MVLAPIPLVVVWRDHGEGSRCRWSLRRILPDGKFVGDATFYDERRQTSFEGMLSADDTAEVWRLASVIRETSSENCHTDAPTAWDALLAEGAYSAPAVIYRFCAGDEESSPIAEDFKTLIALLRPYVDTAMVHDVS